jgi:hypothetical protein
MGSHCFYCALTRLVENPSLTQHMEDLSLGACIDLKKGVESTPDAIKKDF